MGLLQSSENRNIVGDYLREMNATFLFTVIAGLTSDNIRDTLIPALAIGLGCAILVQSERAHMNPVISIAITACDSEKGWTEFFLRVLAQLVGCIFGGLTAVDGLRDVRLDFAVGSNSNIEIGLCFEIIFTFILVLAVLRTRKFPSGAFVHGFCYTIGVLAGAKTVFSGNSLLNPAVAVGIMLGSASYDSSTEESYLWIYLIGPILGTLLAILFFQFTELLLDFDEEESSTEGDETTEFVPRTELTSMQQRDAPREKFQVPGTIQRPVTRGELTPGNALPRGANERPLTRQVMTPPGNAVPRSNPVEGVQNAQTAQRGNVGPNVVGFRRTHQQI